MPKYAALKAIKEKAAELNNSQLHMFTDHVKVINHDCDDGKLASNSSRFHKTRSREL